MTRCAKLIHTDLNKRVAVIAVKGSFTNYCLNDGHAVLKNTLQKRYKTEKLLFDKCFCDPV